MINQAYTFEESSPQRDRWLLSYADLLTLLLAFFVVMYSISVVNEKKLYELATSLDAELMGLDIIEVQEEEVLEAPLLGGIEIPNVGVNKQIGEWLELTLDSKFLFSSGSADLKTNIDATLKNLMLVLESTQGDIRVEGHTDSNPISTQRFPSNWELSAARAAAVVRHFESKGILSARLSATGLASSNPIADNDSELGREKNRRVVLKIRALDEDLVKINALSFEEEALSPVGDDEVENFDLNEFDLNELDHELLLQVLNELEKDT